MNPHEPDEFDRIVEGLELDSPEEHEFAALENLPAEPVADPAPTFDPEFDSPDEPPSEDSPEFAEVTYRQAPAVSSSGNPFRQWGWLALAAVPITLIVFSIADVYLSPTAIGLIVVGAVSLLAYLLLTNPDSDSNDSINDDGSSV